VFAVEDEALEMERNGRFGGLSSSANPGVIGSGVFMVFLEVGVEVRMGRV
jgi:hypothetical protein